MAGLREGRVTETITIMSTTPPPPLSAAYEQLHFINQPYKNKTPHYLVFLHISIVIEMSKLNTLSKW